MPLRPGLIPIHFATFLAGAAGVFGKYLSCGPSVITCGRCAFGAITLAIVALFTGTSLRTRTGRQTFTVVLSGLILALHWFAFFQSIQVSSVAIGVLSFSAFPLFATLLEPVFFNERLTHRDLGTTALVLMGLFLVTPSLNPADATTAGILWGLLSALTFAVLSLLSRSLGGQLPSPTISFYQQAVAALVLLPLAWNGAKDLTGQDWLLLLLLGTVFTALAQTLTVSSLKHLPARTVGVIFGLEAPYGILLAWLLLQEVPTARTFAGGALIGAAVIWASLRPTQPSVVDVSPRATTN